MFHNFVEPPISRGPTETNPGWTFEKIIQHKDNNEEVEEILKCYPCINEVDTDGRTLLSLMVEEDLHYGKFIELALEQGADVFRTMSDQNPDSIAAEIIKSRKIESIRALMNNIPEKDHPLDSSGNTALHLVVSYGIEELFDEVLEAVDDIHIRNKMKETPLHVALNSGSIQFTELLLSRGADINATDLELNTPLHLAVSIRGIANKKEIVELLLKHQPDMNARNCFSWTPLLSLSGTGEKSPVLYYLLMEAGADINIGDFTGLTPIHIVCLNNAFSVSKLLFKCADIDIETNGGYTPLYFSILGSHAHNTEVLLENGASLNMFLVAFCLSDQTPTITQLLISYILLRKSKNTSDIHPHMEMFLSQILEQTIHQEHATKVEAEIEVLKASKIVDSGVSLWDIAVSDTEGIVTILKNTNVVVQIMRYESFRQFTIFGSSMWRKCNKAFRRRMLIDECSLRLPRIMQCNLPLPCLEKILTNMQCHTLSMIVLVYSWMTMEPIKTLKYKLKDGRQLLPSHMWERDASWWDLYKNSILEKFKDPFQIDALSCLEFMEEDITDSSV